MNILLDPVLAVRQHHWNDLLADADRVRRAAALDPARRTPVRSRPLRLLHRLGAR